MRCGASASRAGGSASTTGRRDLRECVRLFQPLHDLTGIGFGVQALSWCAASTSPDEAARLLGASHAVWRTSGAKIDETSPYTQVEKGLQEAVPRLSVRPPSSAPSRTGRRTFDEAVALALGRGRRRVTAVEPLHRQGRGGGSWRPDQARAGDRRPARRGLTNREIAARLVIAQRTAETHVDHILSKLGMTSRAQVAAWVAEQPAR